jgi:hypothetical protein
MANKETLAERLRSMALEVRARLLDVDERLRVQGLVVLPDSLFASVRRDLDRLVGDMEDLANRSEVGVLGDPATPGTVKH